MTRNPPRQRKVRKRQKAVISVRAKSPVIRVEKSWMRLNQSRKKVVYFIRGNEPVKYRWGESRILYIGRTERNAKRPFESLKAKAEELLGKRGITSLDVVYIEARGRRRVAVAEKLENACLYRFRQLFGDVPLANVAGSRRLKLFGVKRYFNLDRIDGVLNQLSQVEN